MSVRFKADIDRALSVAVERQGIDVLALTFSKTQSGDPLRACVFRGKRIYARFDQQPPEGSIPLEADPRDYWGCLFFLSPDDVIWMVPAIWYNNTWRHVIEELSHNLQHLRDKQKDDIASIQLLAGRSDAEAKAARLILEAAAASREYSIPRAEHRLRHIKDHTVDILDQCPHLAPIPRHYYE